MQITREIVLEEIRRIARELGKNQLSLSEFRSNSDVSKWQIWNLFDGWNEAVMEAGLEPHREKEKIDENNFAKEMREIKME